MKNQFKVGDKVKVRADLQVGKLYGNDCFVSDMQDMRGKVTTIAEVGTGSDGKKYYVAGGGTWNYTAEMLEEVPETKVIFNGKATVLIKDGKKYVSKCKDGDAYDKEKGLLLCLAQANGISYRGLQEMIAGVKGCGVKQEKAQVREVKRPAKVGEYIKIVAADAGEPYGNGDILQVKEAAGVSVRTYLPDGKQGNTWGGREEGYFYIYDSEYVVLENYTPYKITLSEFLKKGAKIAVNLKTDDEYNAFIKACHKRGHFKCWSEDKSRMYGGNYCLSRLRNYGFCDKAFYIIEGCTVYNFDEVDLEN